MKREPSWRDLGRTVADLLKSLDPDLRGCSTGTDTRGPVKRTEQVRTPRPGYPRDWR